jgi:integrase
LPIGGLFRLPRWLNQVRLSKSKLAKNPYKSGNDSKNRLNCDIITRFYFQTKILTSMARVNFNLRKRDSEKPEIIYLVIRRQKSETKYSTGLAVVPKYWNDETQRIRNTTNVKDRDKINNRLNELEAEMLRFTTDLVASGQLFDAKTIRDKLDLLSGKALAPDQTFFGFLETYIQGLPGKVQPNGKVFSSRTIQKYRTFQKHMQAFAAKSKRGVNFHAMDSGFFDELTRWMNSRHFAVNTVHKLVETLRTVLNQAFEAGHLENQAFRKFKIQREDSESVYLTEKELQRLAEFDLSKNPRLDRVRDLFLLGAYTGLRYGDFSRLSPEHFKNGTIEIEQAKTGGKVIIPILKEALPILQKYNYNFPKGISNQKTNDYVKEVCKLAGITEQVQKGITKGGQRIVSTLEKWELVSTHTARRSFATNSYLRGIPAQTIMRITGHKSIAVFEKYIKLNADQHADLYRKLWEESTPKAQEQAAE